MRSGTSSLHSLTMAVQRDVNNGLQHFFVIFELPVTSSDAFCCIYQKVTPAAQAMHLALVIRLRETTTNVNIVQ